MTKIRKEAKKFVRLFIEQVEKAPVAKKKLLRLFKKTVENLQRSPVKEELCKYPAFYIKFLHSISQGEKSKQTIEAKGTGDLALKGSKLQDTLPFNLFAKPRNICVNNNANVKFNKKFAANCLLHQQVKNLSHVRVLKLLEKQKGNVKDTSQLLKHMQSLCKLSIGRFENAEDLHRIMSVFQSEILDDTSELLSCKRKRMIELQGLLYQFLLFFHTSSLRLKEMNVVVKPSYEELLSSFLSLYIDMEICCCQEETEEQLQLKGKRLASRVVQLLDRWPTFVLEVLLQLTNHLMQCAGALLQPLLKKALLRRPKKGSFKEYTEFVCCVRHVKPCMQDNLLMKVEEFVLGVPAPKHYLKWLREQNASILDEIPETQGFKGTRITHFLYKEASDDLLESLLMLLSAIDVVLPEKAPKPDKKAKNDDEEVEPEPEPKSGNNEGLYFFDKTANENVRDTVEATLPQVNGEEEDEEDLENESFDEEDEEEEEAMEADSEEEKSDEESSDNDETPIEDIVGNTASALDALLKSKEGYEEGAKQLDAEEEEGSIELRIETESGEESESGESGSQIGEDDSNDDGVETEGQNGQADVKEKEDVVEKDDAKVAETVVKNIVKADDDSAIRSSDEEDDAFDDCITDVEKLTQTPPKSSQQKNGKSPRSKSNYVYEVEADEGQKEVESSSTVKVSPLKVATPKKPLSPKKQQTPASQKKQMSPKKLTPVSLKKPASTKKGTPSSTTSSKSDDFEEERPTLVSPVGKRLRPRKSFLLASPAQVSRSPARRRPSISSEKSDKESKRPKALTSANTTSAGSSRDSSSYKTLMGTPMKAPPMQNGTPSSSPSKMGSPPIRGTPSTSSAEALPRRSLSPSKKPSLQSISPVKSPTRVAQQTTPPAKSPTAAASPAKSEKRRSVDSIEKSSKKVATPKRVVTPKNVATPKNTATPKKVATPKPEDQDMTQILTPMRLTREHLKRKLGVSLSDAEEPSASDAANAKKIQDKLNLTPARTRRRTISNMTKESVTPTTESHTPGKKLQNDILSIIYSPMSPDRLASSKKSGRRRSMPATIAPPSPSMLNTPTKKATVKITRIEELKSEVIRSPSLRTVEEEGSEPRRSRRLSLQTGDQPSSPRTPKRPKNSPLTPKKELDATS